MTDITNKTLALFLLTATIVSLGGFIVSFNRLTDAGLTGRATTNMSTTGQSNFSINGSLAIAFLINSADFGVGQVNMTGAHNCTLNTSLAMSLGTDCSGFYTNVPPLVIQNQGTQNVSLNLSFNASATQFISATNAYFGVKFSANDTTPCNSTNFNSGAWISVPLNTNLSICNNTGFNWVGGGRTINIDLGLRIPQEAIAGSRVVGITAWGTSP